ncbi:MAG: curli production assembly protein CsgG [Acidobacteria bacterium]|nr:curli production assembly protein CsgG [Acidobacteriota bacterium]
MFRKIQLLLLTTVLAMPATAQAPKKRVAILDFDYATVHTYVSSIWGTNVDVGKGVADLLVEKMVNSGVYSVIERKAIDKILAEQNFSNSDRTDASTAAKIGKILGVDAIVMGSITQFGRDDKQTNIGGAALGGVRSRFGIGGLGLKSAKAVVALTARMVNTNTAEILAAVTAQGESKRSGTGLLGAGGSSGTAVGGVVDMKSTNFASSILGEAVNAATASLATQLGSSAARLPTTVVQVNGMVADVSGDTLILNVGSKAGVRVGDQLKIMRENRSIKDPATGRVLRRVEDAVGTVRITEVDEASAVGKFSGAGKPQVKDTVRNN